MTQVNRSAPASQAQRQQRQIATLLEALTVLVEEGQVVEVRILGVEGRPQRVASGYFNEPSALVKALVPHFTEQALGIHITLNPVKPDLLARAANRIKPWAQQTTGDGDIVWRRWLLIDLDPLRPSGISSTDAEHAAALRKARQILAWLSEQGWPEPVLADSGNGAHLLYPIDLPNDPTTTLLIKECLQAQALVWDDEVVGVDTSTFTAGRISKLYGTKARKGDDTPDRPHRWSAILQTPEARVNVTVAQLQALADRLPLATPDPPDPLSRTGRSFDLEGWMERHGITGKRREWQGGLLWRLDRCPFSEDHTDGAYLGQFASGALFAGCFHQRCQGKGWRDLRARYDDPGTGRGRPHDMPPIGPPVSPGLQAQPDPLALIEVLDLEGEMPPLPAGVTLDIGLAAGACRWLEEYVAFSRTWSPRAYDDFHTAAGLWLLSTVAARRVVLDLGGERFTQLYIALAARTSLYAKSTTAGIALALLRQAGLSHLLAPDDATPQAFVRALALAVPDGWTHLSSAEQAEQRRRLAFAAQKGWYFDEFGQKVAAMMREGGFMGDFRGLLRKFDDCPERYEYLSVNRGSDLALRPYLALLANLTPADLQPYARKHAPLWSDGFWARFAFVCPPADAPRPQGHFPTGERRIPESLVQPLRAWHARLGVPEVRVERLEDDEDLPTGKYAVRAEPLAPKRCVLGGGVWAAYNRYNDALLDLVAESRSQDLDGNYARLAEKALRVAMLLASLENHEHIELRHWAKAQAVAESWRRNLHHLYRQVSGAVAESKGRSYEEAILRLLAERGPQTKRELYKNIWGLDSQTAGGLLKSMEEAELVKPVPGGRAMRYHLVP